MLLASKKVYIIEKEVVRLLWNRILCYFFALYYRIFFLVSCVIKKISDKIIWEETWGLHSYRSSINFVKKKICVNFVEKKQNWPILHKIWELNSHNKFVNLTAFYRKVCDNNVTKNKIKKFQFLNDLFLNK